jgi:hypothetical protein
MDRTTYVGGCQCGRVRYEAEGPAGRATVCYCRMCQKASGAPFMAFVRFPADQVAWTTPPDTFFSSGSVQRGFCRVCGTPLTFRNVQGSSISVTLNSLDHPEAVKLQGVFFPRQKATWLSELDALPVIDEDASSAPGFVNHQRPDQ